MRVAEACSVQHSTFQPESGVLPPNPTVYFFTRDEGEIVASAPMTADVIARSNDLVVHRVRIAATTGDVTVTYRDRDGGVWDDARYRIGLVPPNTSYVTGATFARHRIALAVTGTAIAFRFDWGDRAPSVVQGHRPRIALDRTISDKLAEGDFELVALFADGSEQSFGRSNLRFSREPLPWWLGTRANPLVFDALAFVFLFQVLAWIHRWIAHRRFMNARMF